jgi:hypothetical protein
MVKNMPEVKLKVEFSLGDVISAIKELGPEEKEFFIENLLAATSPEYLESIREARADYKKGRIVTHAEMLKKGS